MPGGSLVREAVWEQQQEGRHTDLTLHCGPGPGLPAHLVLLAGPLRRAGVVVETAQESLLLPGVDRETLTQVLLPLHVCSSLYYHMQALQALYLWGDQEPLLQQLTGGAETVKFMHKYEVKSEAQDQEDVDVKHMDIKNECLEEEQDTEVQKSDENFNKPKNAFRTQNQRYFCQFCNFKSRSVKDLAKHMRNRHEPSRDTNECNNDIYKCNLCAYKTNQSSGLKIHMIQSHGAKRRAEGECIWCGFKSLSSDVMEAHLLQRHSLRMSNMSCKQCSFIADRPESLAFHQKSVHGTKFPCDACDKVFLSSEKLEAHKNSQRHTDGTVMKQCDQCGFQTLYQARLLQHVRSVHSGEQFSCEKCEYIGSSAFQLKKHVKG